ncbi:MAG: multifunctional CCA addition/repair protein [Pseudomonadota bacterium]
MKIYLVGGAVRDQLLGLPVKEKDFVVVGAKPSDLLEKGFKSVGKDFPVFLHPDTHEQYALARTEKKISKGYTGFQFHAAPDVTLEEDLRRRDLTINAIAQTEDGTIIDPYHGQEDLKNRVFRHVSEAFVEDPVRVLRLARFATRFKDFTVAPKTIALMKRMGKSGELDALVPERIWQELNRALCEAYPWRFFEVLKKCDALKIIFPEIDALFGVPNPEKWHPEIDSGIHTLKALEIATQLSTDPTVRFAALVHDFGKGKTPAEEWPRHLMHDQRGITIVHHFCKRIRVPHAYQDLALLTVRHHSACHKIFNFLPKTILKLLMALDPFRRPKRFFRFLLACEADFRGRKTFENKPYPQAQFLKMVYEKCNELNVRALIENVPQEKIAETIYEARLKIIKQMPKPAIEE